MPFTNLADTHNLPFDAVESLLVKLVHDLRQPLGNIETSAYCLKIALDGTSPRAGQHVKILASQVEEADRILTQAVNDLRRLRSQRPAAAGNLPIANPHTAAVA